MALPLRFDRNEVAGAFGDLGTDFPLLVGMILAAGLDVASVVVVFGALQVLTGLHYRMPMPVQPLKAVAAIVIAQRLPPGTIYGAGLAIGALMLALAATGLLDRIARVVPHAVVRGLQIGLGLQLSLVALRDFLPAAGLPGWLLAGASAALVAMLWGNRRFPAAPLVVALGLAFALGNDLDLAAIAHGIGPALPGPRLPGWADVASGFVLLALPQVPLSIGNSVLATRQLAVDLFPSRTGITVRRIGLTYAAMNLLAPLAGGVPVCHGSGGLAGHYAHGGRTGGSVILYGAFYLVLGLGFSGAFGEIVHAFPRPVLGVLLLVEGLMLLRVARDLHPRNLREGPLALATGLVAVTLPYGYAIALVAGTVIARLPRKVRAATHTA